MHKLRLDNGQQTFLEGRLLGSTDPCSMQLHQSTVSSLANGIASDGWGTVKLLSLEYPAWSNCYAHSIKLAIIKEYHKKYYINVTICYYVSCYKCHRLHSQRKKDYVFLSMAQKEPASATGLIALMNVIPSYDFTTQETCSALNSQIHKQWNYVLQIKSRFLHKVKEKLQLT